jgi:Rieske Fe-S protein
MLKDPDMASTERSHLTRRGVLAGAAAVGVASALVACGDDASPPGASGSGNDAGTDTGAEGAGGNDVGGGAGETVNASDVPVGSAVIVGNLVVSQPTVGQYRAFSAVCTHQGCLVSRVEGDEIRCTCHNSAFSAVDGSVLAGPATRSLTAKTVTVAGSSLTIT